MNKKRLYSIIYLISLVLLLNSIPFYLFIKNQLILILLNIAIKGFSIYYILNYIKKEGLNPLKKEKITASIVRLVPLIFLCFSNFIVAVVQDSTVRNNINITSIIYGLITAVGVGIVEELLFRSQVLEEFLRHKNKKEAIFYSSLIFGSIHLLNLSSIASIPSVLTQIAYTFFLGIVLGYIYVNTKNIYIPIVFHILYNFINSVLVVEIFYIKWNFTFFIVNIFVGIIVFIYMLGISRINNKKEDDYVS